MFDQLSKRFHRWQTYRRTYAELSGLSRRELDDIGISQTDIVRIARDTARSR
ncbi:MAG: DUF1127 domain-containing protein [Geminicoccaceae bacterium]